MSKKQSRAAGKCQQLFEQYGRETIPYVIFSKVLSDDGIYLEEQDIQIVFNLLETPGTKQVSKQRFQVFYEQLIDVNFQADKFDIFAMAADVKKNGKLDPGMLQRVEDTPEPSALCLELIHGAGKAVSRAQFIELIRKLQ